MKKGMKKNTIYIILGVLIVLAIIAVYLQMNKSPSEISESGEEIANCGEGTVIYGDDDLCWQRGTMPERAENWQAASDYCENLVLAEKDDWKLPTTDELSSIIDDSFKEIVINPEYFQDTEQINYWTSSQYREGLHWYIHFELGYQGFAQDFRKDYGVRCVRENTLF